MTENNHQEPESKHPVLSELNATISNLESLLKAQKDTSARYAEKYRTTQNNAQALLKELLDDEEIEYEVAKRIADLFDSVSLSKTVDVSYTITATVSVEVPYNTDPDSVGDNVFVERVDFYSQDYDYDILETDFDVEDYNVRH